MKLIKKYPDPCGHVIGELERLLEQAKSGELRSILFVGSYNNGDYVHGWGGFSKDEFGVLGKLSVLERDYMDARIDLLRKPFEEYCE